MPSRRCSLSKNMKVRNLFSIERSVAPLAPSRKPTVSTGTSRVETSSRSSSSAKSTSTLPPLRCCSVILIASAASSRDSSLPSICAPGRAGRRVRCQNTANLWSVGNQAHFCSVVAYVEPGPGEVLEADARLPLLADDVRHVLWGQADAHHRESVERVRRSRRVGGAGRAGYVERTAVLWKFGSTRGRDAPRGLPACMGSPSGPWASLAAKDC